MATANTGLRADDFYRLIPRRSMAVFLMAVFFVFAPVGVLLVSSFAQERPLGLLLFYLLASGLVALERSLRICGPATLMDRPYDCAGTTPAAVDPAMSCSLCAGPTVRSASCGA